MARSPSNRGPYHKGRGIRHAIAGDLAVEDKPACSSNARCPMARRPRSPAVIFLWFALLLALAVRPARAPAQGTNPISFAPPQVIPVSADGTGPAVADFDGDGKLDVAVAGASG